MGSQRLLTALILTPILAVACVDFASVKSAATAAQKIGDSSAIFADMEQDCIAIKTLLSKDVSACKNRATAANRIAGTAKGLSDYGAKLLAIVNEKDTDPSAKVAALLSAGSTAGWYSKLSSDTSTEFKSLAKDIVSVLSLVYRKEQVSEAIDKANGAIQTVSATLTGSAAATINEIRDEESAMQTLADNESDTWKKFVAGQFQVKLEAQKSQLATFIKTVDSFAKAHAKLEAAKGSFDSDTLKAVMQIFQDAFGGNSQAGDGGAAPVSS